MELKTKITICLIIMTILTVGLLIIYNYDRQTAAIILFIVGATNILFNKFSKSF